MDRRIFLELRLPRAVLGLLVGASLGVGGAALISEVSVSFAPGRLHLLTRPRFSRASPSCRYLFRETGTAKG